MKRIYVFYVCFALCMALFAQATDLTIDNQTPGWLSSKISQADRLTVENLKVTGYVNVNDLKFIGGLMENRNLHGCVDLSEVYVVGNKDNYMGKGSFNSDGTVNRLILPKTLEELENCLVAYSYPEGKYLHVDTLVFAPDNMKFVKGPFFSERITNNQGNFEIIGVPTHLFLGGAIDSIPGLSLLAGSRDGFRDHPGLKSVHFPPNMKYIGDCAFCGCGIEETNINDLQELEYIGEFAFTNKGTAIIPVFQPDTLKLMGVKYFNASAFEYKEGQHIFFGENIVSISTGADLKYSYGFGKRTKLIFHMKSKTPPTGHYPDNSCTAYVPKGAAAAYSASSWGAANVTIVEENPLEVIKISPLKIKLEAGETQQLTPTFIPDDADDLTLDWSSADPAIVTVDADGLVSGVTPGITTVYATSVATGVQGSCEVTVIQHATDIQMETPQITMTKLGETKQLSVTVLPENTTDKTVKWSSSNPSICTVTASGKIVAMGYGDAVIMAITNDGEIPATCIVKVARPKYKFTYMVDGAEYKSYEVEFNSPITPEAEPTKEGYTFSGWSEVPATMPAKDVTVNGSFVINKYKLTYIVDGETYKTDEIEYGKSVIPEAEPEKEGYSFSGWSMIPETMPAKDVTVTGSFTKGEYQLIYIVDGQVYKTIHMNYGDAVLVEDAPQKEGYTFSGWSEIPGTMPAKDIAVMGSFTVNSYKLTYTVDGEEYKSVQVNYGAAIIPEAEPTKEGYSFSGWGDIPATMPSCDVAVAGSFTVNSYKLIYMVDGEEYKIVDVAYGTSITAEAEPTKEGYSFSGWGEIPATMPANDVTVTGSFTINKYTLVYVVDGENYVTYEVNYDTQIFPLPDLTKDGYTFSGWSDIPATMPAHDVTITGTFTFVDAIEGVLADDGEYQIYTLDGMPIETLQKGVNIIKYISGKVKKVVVK